MTRYDMQATADETVKFLEDLADTLDEWAETSRRYGWSTHQVDANRQKANDCRRQAYRLRSAVSLPTPQ